MHLQAASAFAVTSLIMTSGTLAADCPDPGRQPATEALIALVESDPALQEQLTRSIALGQIINSDPNTNPVASLEDYYDFVDALVTYPPQNIKTGVVDEGIRVSMDGSNYCNWNILDILSYSYFLVDRQLTTDPRGQIQFENDAFSAWMRDVAVEWGKYLETPASAVHVPDFTSDPNFGDWYCPPETAMPPSRTSLYASSVPPPSRPDPDRWKAMTTRPPLFPSVTAPRQAGGRSAGTASLSPHMTACPRLVR